MDPVSFAAVGWSIRAVGWVISPVVSKLIQRCCSYLCFDASKKLEELGPKVLLLERVMEVAEGSPYKDSLEKLCKDLKSALYEAEDILDEIEYHRLERMVQDDKLKSDESASGFTKNSLMKKVRSYLQKKRRKEAHSPQKDHQEIGVSKCQLKNSFEKIERVINDACKILEQLNLPSVANSDGRQVSAANSRSAVTTADPPLKVIGRDDERDKIIAMLHEKECDGQQNPNSDVCYSVIGIHGVAGSGKSTLAQHIYAHEKDKKEKKDGHFDLLIWIHVSQKFDLDAIFQDMLEGATGMACPKFNSRNAVVETLEDKLHAKRIFLVLDDVWYNIRNQGHQLARELEELLSPLKVGMTGSKVLVTSRTKDALKALNVVEERCIRISDLPEKVFLQMFMHYAFRGVRVDGHDRIKLQMIGADIAKKLNRSPLAARTVGSQLCLRPNAAFWRMTRDQDLLKETKGALWWSYRHLDEQVRRCFAYCSIFPRRYRLERDKLVRLWVAEGFIKTTAEVELDAISKDYFDELLSASFLQLGGKRQVQDDMVEYFTVHDLLRDLAEEVAGSDCFRIEEGWMGDVPQDVRHLFVGTRKIHMEKIFKLKNLRTLIITSDAPRKQEIEEKEFEIMFKKLLKLQVLSVEFRFTNHIKFTVPESIGRLKHLRYLVLKVGIFTDLVLPRSLTNLYNLQLLDFGGCYYLVFPNNGEDMNQLVNLRRVITIADLKFPNIGKLTWLQELRFFTVKNEHGYELRQLKNLNKLQGKLQIHGLGNVGSKDEATEANLADKEQLAELVLCWGDGSCSPPEVQAEVLEALCPSKYLETLEIRDYSGLTYPDWMVGKHEGGPKHLQKLHLSRIQLGPPHQLFEFFVHLRFLTFMCCDWHALPDNIERLTNLKILRLSGLENIRALPTLPLSLEEIRVESCNTTFMASCKTIGDPNWEKIQHIPIKKLEDERGYNFYNFFHAGLSV